MWKYEPQKEIRRKDGMFTESQQHMVNKIAYSVKESSKDCRGLAHNSETCFKQNCFPSASCPKHLHCTRTLALFNSWWSLFRFLTGYQICQSGSSTFFSALDDFSISVRQTNRGVQSVSDLVPDPLLHLKKYPLLSRRTWKACCPLQRSVALVVCSNFKETMFMFSTMAQQWSEI